MTAEQFDVMLRRQFDTLWRESEERALVMGIALHPYIIGFPHRIGALDSALALPLVLRLGVLPCAFATALTVAAISALG